MINKSIETYIELLEEARHLNCGLERGSVVNGWTHHHNPDCFKWDADALNDLLSDLRREHSLTTGEDGFKPTHERSPR